MASSSTKFPLGVYVGGPNGSDSTINAAFDARYANFTKVMGSGAQFMNAYIDQTKSILEWAANASWTAWSWSRDVYASGLTPVIGMPMSSTAMGLSNSQIYQNFASGQYDNAIRGMVKSWADQGFRTQYWRPGWEMNVSGMPNYIGDDKQTQSDWISAFQHISDVLHSAGNQQGVDVQVVWNPNVQNWNTTNPLTLYPGNRYVDVIAADLYDNIYPYSLANLGKGDGSIAGSFAEWAADPANLAFYYSNPAATQWSLDGSEGHSMSLQNLLDFTKQQGKPFAIAETGAGGSGANEPNLRDDATFPQWLASTLAASGVEVRFVTIWDVNYEGSWSYSDPGANKPNEAASWASNFGAASGSQGMPTTLTSPITVEPGTNVLALSVSEDAWLGDAQFTVAIDGGTIGGVHTATASHAAGASQTLSFSGNWGAGPHTVSITFINDAWGGSSASDRNLYADKVTYDGRIASNAPAMLDKNGTASFAVAAADAGTATPLAAQAAAAAVLRLADDAGQGNASIGSGPVPQPILAPASSALGQSQIASPQAALTLEHAM